MQIQVIKHSKIFYPGRHITNNQDTGGPLIMSTAVTIDANDYDAFIFDLDGVVTETAKIHARAWKKTFDVYLKKRAKNGGEYIPFDIATDYARYVDGIPRYDGVRNFLESRQIHIPYGSPEDSSESETICGLGNKKNKLFQEYIKEGNVFVYDSTIDLIKALRENKIKTGIISSSKNCTNILRIVHITHLFDTKIDGNDSVRLGLKGKPDPDIFIAAVRNLEVDPRRAAVVEDAILGVSAGKTGNFRLVVGIDRTHHAEELRKNGADIVVSDLSEIHLQF